MASQDSQASLDEVDECLRVKAEVERDADGDDVHDEQQRATRCGGAQARHRSTADSEERPRPRARLGGAISGSDERADRSGAC
eukprot:4632298-Prymnesium_polylepis.1